VRPGQAGLIIWEGLSNPEIDELHSAPHQQEVVKLEVCMHDAVRLDLPHCLQEQGQPIVTLLQQE
jgi:hypothetical protein